MAKRANCFSLFAFLIVGAVFLVACQQQLMANAGEDVTIVVGERPFFDGCDSTGSIVNYQWTIITPSANMPEDAGKAIRTADSNCSFTLEAEMGLDEVGTWIIELEVQDGAGNSASDEVTVEVVES